MRKRAKSGKDTGGLTPPRSPKGTANRVGRATKANRSPVTDHGSLDTGGLTPPRSPKGTANRVSRATKANRSPVTDHRSPITVARQADVAEFCGVSIDSVKNWAKQGMPGKAPSYDLAEIVQWLRRDGPWQPRGGQQLLDSLGDEILLEGGKGDSPALEKLRAAKAALAELDLQQRRGQLISVEQSKEIGLRWATLIKRMGERLGKRFGRDATAAVNDTLEECERVLQDGYAAPADPDADAELVDAKRTAKASKADRPVGRRRNRRAKRAARR